MRLIDADAAITEWRRINNIDENDRGARFVGYTEIPRLLNHMPTINAEPAKHGEWIVYEMHTTQYGKVGFQCSACGVPYKLEHRLGADVGWHYCPTCGAKNR